MGLRVDMAVRLLAMALITTYICEAALLKKSKAAAFLRPALEKRDAECFPAGCSMEDSEMEETLEVNSDSGREALGSDMQQSSGSHTKTGGEFTDAAKWFCRARWEPEPCWRDAGGRFWDVALGHNIMSRPEY